MKESEQAFENAITAGRLSANPQDANYAGNYMYMGAAAGAVETADGLRDAFKHIDTRQYIQ